MDIRTGQKQYNPCDVCNGTGRVSDEKAYYSEYPDVSLSKAGQLISEKGKPVKVEIVSNHKVYLHFVDGSKYLFGGFTVGYRGTGPEYTQRLLLTCGFDNVSYNEIVDMTPPKTYTAE